MNSIREPMDSEFINRKAAQDETLDSKYELLELNKKIEITEKDLNTHKSILEALEKNEVDSHFIKNLISHFQEQIEKNQERIKQIEDRFISEPQTKDNYLITLEYKNKNTKVENLNQRVERLQRGNLSYEIIKRRQMIDTLEKKLSKLLAKKNS